MAPTWSQPAHSAGKGKRDWRQFSKNNTDQVSACAPSLTPRRHRDRSKPLPGPSAAAQFPLGRRRAALIPGLQDARALRRPVRLLCQPARFREAPLPPSLGLRLPGVTPNLTMPLAPRSRGLGLAGVRRGPRGRRGGGVARSR